jgi:hypothetical protein
MVWEKDTEVYESRCQFGTVSRQYQANIKTNVENVTNKLTFIALTLPSL